MKVLFINTYHYQRGGDTRYAFGLAEILRSNGHEVRLLSMKHPKNLPSDDEKYFLSFIDYRELNQNKSFSNIIKVISRSLYSFEAKKKIRLLLNDFKPDIVHLFNIHAHITPSVIFEIKKHRIPIVWTLNDYKLICPNSHFINDRTGNICEDCKKNKFYKPIINKCKKNSLGASIVISLEAYIHKYIKVLDNVSFLLCQSKFQLEKMLEFGISKDKLKYLPLFIETNPSTTDSIASDYFLFFGRIEKFKGIFTLIDAFQDIQHIKLKIIGSLAEDIETEFFAKLSANIEYIGFVSDNEKNSMITKAIAVIVPSENYENQPFSILESFSNSKAIIASNLGGMKELLYDSGGGYLFEPGNSTQLKNIVLDMFNNRNNAVKLGALGREYVNEYHSPKLHYEELLKFYNCLVS